MQCCQRAVAKSASVCVPLAWASSIIHPEELHIPEAWDRCRLCSISSHLSILGKTLLHKAVFFIKLCRRPSFNNLLIKVTAEVFACTGEAALLSTTPVFSPIPKHDPSVLAVGVWIPEAECSVTRNSIGSPHWAPQIPHLLNSTPSKAGRARKQREEEEQPVVLDLPYTGTEHFGSRGGCRSQTTALVQFLSPVVLIHFCIPGYRRTIKEEKTQYHTGERRCSCTGHSQNRWRMGCSLWFPERWLPCRLLTRLGSFF